MSSAVVLLTQALTARLRERRSQWSAVRRAQCCSVHAPVRSSPSVSCAGLRCAAPAATFRTFLARSRRAEHSGLRSRCSSSGDGGGEGGGWYLRVSGACCVLCCCVHTSGCEGCSETRTKAVSAVLCRSEHRTNRARRSHSVFPLRCSLHTPAPLAHHCELALALPCTRVISAH